MFSTPDTRHALCAQHARPARREPLSEDQMRAAAPSVFAEGKHASRSERYTYIPTIEVLRGLRKEGFEPFMVAQGPSRVEGKTEFTKHMVRMRHADGRRRPARGQRDHPHQQPRRRELVSALCRSCSDSSATTASSSATWCEDIRIPHKGDVEGEVIEGAFRVLDQFDAVDDTPKR